MVQFKALIALGANDLDDSRLLAQRLVSALGCLESGGVDVLRCSRFYRSPCFPAGFGNSFVNAAACVATNIGAAALLEVLHQVEAEFGRERKQRWGTRSLDLDLLSYEAQISPDRAGFEHWRNLSFKAQSTESPEKLILPHPRIEDRAFVLLPLLDVAPDWRHPVYGSSITEMISALPETATAGVEPLEKQPDLPPRVKGIP